MVRRWLLGWVVRMRGVVQLLRVCMMLQRRSSVSASSMSHRRVVPALAPFFGPIRVLRSAGLMTGLPVVGIVRSGRIVATFEGGAFEGSPTPCGEGMTPLGSSIPVFLLNSIVVLVVVGTPLARQRVFLGKAAGQGWGAGIYCDDAHRHYTRWLALALLAAADPTMILQGGGSSSSSSTARMFLLSLQVVMLIDDYRW